MLYLRVLSVALAATLAFATLLAPAAGATDGKSSVADRDQTVHDPVQVGAAIDSIDIATYDINGRLLSKETIYSNDLQTRDNGAGGSSSASGCKKVTLRNRATTLLGHTAYRFITWTYWCWNRADRTVFDVRTGWYLSDVDSQHIWREMIIDNTNHFSWYSGYSTSGYKHEKQGRIENCIFHYGCILNLYPRNVLYSYSNGTWSWYIYD